jgi:hypothetical protein
MWVPGTAATVAPIDVIAYKGSELKVYSKRKHSILQ